MVAGGTVKNLSVFGDFSTSAYYCGGISGSLAGGTIKNCSFTGKIVSTAEKGVVLGGITGEFWRSGNIENCYANAELVANSAENKVGGIIGYARAGYEKEVQHVKLSSSYAVGKITTSGAKNYIGGIIGNKYISNSDSTLTITNCYYLSGMAKGGVDSEKTSGCTNFNANALKACADMLGSPFKDNNRSDGFNDGYPVFEWQTDPYQFSGAGTSDNPYLIETKQDLLAMRDLLCSPFFNSKYNTKSFKQIADIDMENENWASQKFVFKGTYDGNNKIITNYILDANHQQAGFISVLSGNAIIKNLVIEGSTTGKDYAVGGIVGEMQENSKVINCGFIGDVSTNKSAPKGYVGGVVGYIWQGGAISNCYHYGNVSGYNSANIGGITGKIKLGNNNNIGAKIENCYHAGGKVTSDAEKTGGIVGSIENNKPDTCTINLVNNYFLKGSASASIGTSTLDNDDTYAYPENVMKMLASDLGFPYTSNNDNTIIDGYPVFCWQVEATTKGDINNDGKVTIADAVILQRHILRSDTLTTRNWRAADLCEDNCIDVFDMVMMRRLLLKQDKVKLPNVVGKTEAEATEILNKLGLEIITAYETNDEVAKGIVISQTPKESEVISGSTITLKISSGPAVILPNKLELNRTRLIIPLSE